MKYLYEILLYETNESDCISDTSDSLLELTVDEYLEDSPDDAIPDDVEDLLDWVFGDQDRAAVNEETHDEELADLADIMDITSCDENITDYDIDSDSSMEGDWNAVA